jgi:hypothetical protein
LIIEKNRLDTLIKNARRAMAEVGKSFDTEEQRSINAILGDADAALGSSSLEEIKLQLTFVEGAANRITTAMLAMA